MNKNDDNVAAIDDMFDNADIDMKINAQWKHYTLIYRNCC